MLACIMRFYFYKYSTIPFTFIGQHIFEVHHPASWIDLERWRLLTIFFIFMSSTMTTLYCFDTRKLFLWRKSLRWLVTFVWISLLSPVVFSNYERAFLHAGQLLLLMFQLLFAFSQILRVFYFCSIR